MKAYRTKRPYEHLNARYVRKRDAIRIAAKGRALYVPISTIYRVAEVYLLILITVAAFRAGRAFAYLEQGYAFFGGESFLGLIAHLK